MEQGVKQDGSPKLRACDDFSANNTNSFADNRENLKNENLDDLEASARYFHQVCHIYASSIHSPPSRVLISQELGEDPGILKADVDSAYRRIPVTSSHLWLVWVVFVTNGTVLAAQHHGMPFGAKASVYAWHRFAAFISFIARVVLKIPLLK